MNQDILLELMKSYFDPNFELSHDRRRTNELILTQNLNWDFKNFSLRVGVLLVRIQIISMQ